MKAKKLYKTVYQYNKSPISKKDMEQLLEIAKDYQAVKDYVYQRYGGIKSLDKIYPGYTVQKELADSSFRKQLGLPSVYFNVAVLDALKSIRNQWERTKKKVLKRVQTHPEFSEAEKHYLRFLLKVSNAFGMVLNDVPVCLTSEIQQQYELLSKEIDKNKLNSYLKRQVRKYHVIPSPKNLDGFSLVERAYRYDTHGIYLTTKKKRQRIFIELTDNNAYTKQIYIKLFPKEGNIKLFVPVEMKCKKHPDYTNEVGISFGMHVMLTTDKGHVYGDKLGHYQSSLTYWMHQKNSGYDSKKRSKFGRKKYTANKNRRTEQLHSYINKEINRFLKEEKPKTVYLPKLPQTQKHRGNKEINYAVSTWQRGYIRKRLHQKCVQHSVAFTEVFGKDISTLCCICEEKGEKKENLFLCPNCGNRMNVKVNAAKNVKNRGMNG